MSAESSILDRLKDRFGESMTPKELGKLLQIDPRTVNKYAVRWGGVEASRLG